MATTMQRTRRQATPERWQAALRRAVENGIQVRQLAGCGMWVTTSGSDATVAYEVTGTECECKAAEFGDPVCCHRALWWHRQGMLDLDPEPAPPAPAVAVTAVLVRPATCDRCAGDRFVTKASTIRPDLTYRAPCPACRPGLTPPAFQPAA